MKIELVVTQPVSLSITIEKCDLKAAKKAGIEVDEDSEQFDSLKLSDWLVAYWCSKRSKYAINDLIEDCETGRDAPSPSQCHVNEVVGSNGWLV